jgi:hypothetical protein
VSGFPDRGFESHPLRQQQAIVYIVSDFPRVQTRAILHEFDCGIAGEKSDDRKNVSGWPFGL